MPNTTAGAIAATAGGAGAGLAAGASWGLALGGPLGAAVGAGAGALLGLIGDIGSGRRVANKMTQKGGPQDIINKQLAAISSAQATPEEKAQATQIAWQQFIQATNQFAAQSKEHAQVAKQAIYQTPELTNAVKSLMGGIDPLGQQFTSTMSPSIASATPQSGITLGSVLAPAAAGAAGGLAGGALFPGSDGLVSASAVGGGATPSIGPSIEGGALTTPAIAAPGVAPAGGASLLSRVLPQVISGGTSLLTGVLGANAANNAANTQSQAALEAAKLNAQAGQSAIDFNKEVLAQQQKNAQPWIDAGAGALKSIGEITATPYTLPTAEEARNTPGYQFALEQGQKALEAYERANGTLMSGKAAKDIFNYGIGSADTNYQNVVNNSLNARAANLNPLLSEAGLGQVSTAGVNSNLSTGANNNAQVGLTTAQNVGNLQQQSAQARASGYSTAQSNLLNGFRSVANILTGVFSPAAA